MYTMQECLEKSQRYTQELIEDRIKRGQKERRAIESTYQFVQMAQSEGLPFKAPDSYYSADCPCYTVEDKMQFRTIHKMIGALEKDGTMVADDDARKQLVWYYLRPKSEQYKHIRFKYKGKLPKGSKCRVKRVKQRASTYTTVVCG